MKKVLLLTTTPLKNDGLTKIEMDILEYNKKVIQFDVASSFSFENEFGEKLKKEKFKLKILSSKKSVFAYMHSIYKLIKKEKYDVVYIHGNSAMMLMEALPVKLAGKSKIITHCHNTKSDFPVMHYFFKFFFNCIVDEKIACSSLAAKWAYCGKNITVILNGVDVEKFKFNEEIRKNKRIELGWNDKYIIGHIGRFNKQKNHVKLIDIFLEILKTNKSARLLLVGDGELEEEIKEKVLRNEIQDYVCFLGTTDRVQDYMQAMDIIVLPSKFEGLCIVAIEAQANGLPVILSDKFSVETLATKNVLTLPLKENEKYWADIINTKVYKGRFDNFKILIDGKYNAKIMMDEIQKVLLKD